MEPEPRVEFGDNRIRIRISKDDPEFHLINPLIEGRRHWSGGGSLLSIEDTGMNREAVENFFGIQLFDQEATAAPFPGDVEPFFELMGTEPYDFQKRAFKRLANVPNVAYFAEQGTGKTKMALDKICYDTHMGRLTGVLIIAKSMSIAQQWEEEHIPKHIWPSQPNLVRTWDRKKLPRAFEQPKGDKLEFFCINIDAYRGKGGKAIEQFLKRHEGALCTVIDESQTIKNVSAQRTKFVYGIGERSSVRIIMTGTPIAQDLTDEWSQFKFLDEKIIGIRYKTAFRSQFCRTINHNGTEIVVGHRNLRQLTELVAPYAFRVTKSDVLDLPPKVYDLLPFALSAEQQKLIGQLKKEWRAEIERGNGEINITIAGQMINKIDQIASGFLMQEDGSVVRLEENPRLEALKDFSFSIKEKKIAWCKYQEDARILSEALSSSVVINGTVSHTKRREALERFTEGDAEWLIASAAVAGAGIDGLQKVCNHVFYYTNSHNSIDRLQSEDRTHRIGMHGTCFYYDLVGKGSLDGAKLGSLRRKKNLLDDSMQLIQFMESESA